jgi:predicted aldo/keto reductase-like oxidoreductase
MMEGTNGTCGGNRRQFLQTAAATSAALASADRLLVAADQPAPPTPVPLVTLGKTDQKVTKLGMGTSWRLTPSFVQRAIFSGVRYIDTSENYENTVVEKVLGEVLDRTKTRKDVYLVTKTGRRAQGPGALKVLEDRLNGSLERLKTDYIDAYYMHGLDQRGMGMLRDPDVKAAFETLKKLGKIRFCGLSCHAPNLPEILDAAAEVGWIDQVMIKFNFRDVGGRDRYDDLNRAIDKAHKANIGLVAMKTQGGAEHFSIDPKDLGEKTFRTTNGKDLPYQPRETHLKELVLKGVKKEVAAVKSVWMDGRMQVVVSEMTNFDDLRENIAASRQPLNDKEARLLEEHRRATAHLYCHGCGHLCETAAKGVPVATVLRYYRYYAAYGKREEARALYQALPNAARLLADADLDAAQAACPYNLPVAHLVRQADKHLS